MRLLFLAALPLCGQITVTISPQQSPFPLAHGLALYSVVACGSTARIISAGQIRQAAESGGISFQDPALNSTTISRVTKPRMKALAISKYFSAGGSISAATVAAFKSAAPNVGNAKTYEIIAAAAGALAIGIPMVQSSLQSAQSAAASITTGVQAALVADMTALYPVPAGGCGKSVMFFGSAGAARPLIQIIP